MVIYGMNASVIGVTVDEICTPITPSRGKSSLFQGDSPHTGCRVGPWIKPADSRALHRTPDSACWRRPAYRALRAHRLRETQLRREKPASHIQRPKTRLGSTLASLTLRWRGSKEPARIKTSRPQSSDWLARPSAAPSLSLPPPAPGQRSIHFVHNECNWSGSKISYM